MGKSLPEGSGVKAGLREPTLAPGKGQPHGPKAACLLPNTASPGRSLPNPADSRPTRGADSAAWECLGLGLSERMLTAAGPCSSDPGRDSEDTARTGRAGEQQTKQQHRSFPGGAAPQLPQVTPSNVKLHTPRL